MAHTTDGLATVTPITRGASVPRTPPPGDGTVPSSPLLPLSVDEVAVVFHLRGLQHFGPTCALCMGGRR